MELQTTKQIEYSYTHAAPITVTKQEWVPVSRYDPTDNWDHYNWAEKLGLIMMPVGMTIGLFIGPWTFFGLGGIGFVFFIAGRIYRLS